MTERPYTDEDLLAEAASQHATALRDPDFMGIGEQMTDDIVTSTETDGGGKTWSELLPDHKDFGTAQNAIDNLLTNAADVSDWAINLGADGLEPGTKHVDIGWDNGPLQARIHIAFTSDVPPEEREQLLADIREAIAGTVPVR